MLSDMVREFTKRLQAEEYISRDARKTRREDGAAWLNTAKEGQVDEVVMRLNAYDFGLSAVLTIDVGEGRVTPRSLMVRHRSHGGDDRGLISIPQPPTLPQLPIIENIIFASCTCMQRGEIGRKERDAREPSTIGYSLFLPSQPCRATLSEDFIVSGLPSLY